MSAECPRAGEVLRGMCVEAAPVRVGRPAAAVQRRVDLPAVQPDPLEEALRTGYEDGFRRGHDEGLRAGLAQGLEEAASRVEQACREAVDAAVVQALESLRQERSELGGLARSLAAARESVLAAAEEELVAVCFDTICRVLGSAAVQPEWIRAHCLQAVAAVGAESGVVVHLHPSAAMCMQRLLDDDTEPVAVRCIADPEVSLGGCVVAAPGGGLDARFDTALAAVRRCLVEACAERTLDPVEAQ